MQITREVLDGAMDYAGFKELTMDLLQRGMTTGANHTPAYIEYTRLNLKRMERLDKKTILIDSLVKKITQIDSVQEWVVLVEAWCGDVAQNLPVIAQLAELNHNIDLRILLRDENPETMDLYLTNGGRSIPKLIILNEYLQELGTWGPRPKPIQKMLVEYKERNLPYKEYAEKAHTWYAKDRTQTLQRELEDLLEVSAKSQRIKAA